MVPYEFYNFLYFCNEYYWDFGANHTNFCDVIILTMFIILIYFIFRYILHFIFIYIIILL